MCSLADLPEFEVKVVADYQNVFGGDFVEVGECFNRGADVVVESLRFDIDSVVDFFPDGVKFFVRLPC